MGRLHIPQGAQPVSEFKANGRTHAMTKERKGPVKEAGDCFLDSSNQRFH